MIEVCRERNFIPKSCKLDGNLNRKTCFFILCHNSDVNNTRFCDNSLWNINIYVMSIHEGSQLSKHLPINIYLNRKHLIRFLIELEPNHWLCKRNFSRFVGSVILQNHICIYIRVLFHRYIEVKYIMIRINHNIFEETCVSIHIIFQNVDQSLQRILIGNIILPSNIRNTILRILKIISNRELNLFRHIILNRILQCIIDTLNCVTPSICLQILHIILQRIDESCGYFV